MSSASSVKSVSSVKRVSTVKPLKTIQKITTTPHPKDEKKAVPKAEKSIEKPTIVPKKIVLVAKEQLATKSQPSKKVTVAAKNKKPRLLGRYYLDKLYYSHLDFKYYKDKMRSLGWAETKDPVNANMIICSYWKNIVKWIPTLTDPRFSHRRLAIWTQEPYHDLHKQDANKVTINNVYTGTVFKDNHRYFRWGESDLLSELTEANLSDAEFEARKFPLLALSTKYPKTYWSPNKQTLLPKRYEIIEYGLKHRYFPISKLSLTPVIAATTVTATTVTLADQKADTVTLDKVDLAKIDVAKVEVESLRKDEGKLMTKVWGKGWPEGIAEGESRAAKNREEVKRKILQSGLFNIAVENTDTPYYVSEKIWESIESYCLPIYWPNSTIYEDFPHNSFIDAKAFYENSSHSSGSDKSDQWVAQLYKYIKEMTRKEYIERLNRCIRTFNMLCMKGLDKNLRKDALNRDLHLVDYSRNWDDFKKMFV